jgi:hypothetical protein
MTFDPGELLTRPMDGLPCFEISKVIITDTLESFSSR